MQRTIFYLKNCFAKKKRTRNFLHASWGGWDGSDYDDIEEMIVNQLAASAAYKKGRFGFFLWSVWV